MCNLLEKLNYGLLGSDKIDGKFIDVIIIGSA